MLRVFSIMSIGLAFLLTTGQPKTWAQEGTAPTQPKAAKQDANTKTAPTAKVQNTKGDKASSISTSAFELVDARLTSGIENKEAKDEKNTFTIGDRAWLWMKTKASGEAKFSLRWTWAPNRSWTMNPKQVRYGRMWFYKTLHKTGDWKVEILGDDDKVIKEVSFVVNAKTSQAASPTPGQ